MSQENAYISHGPNGLTYLLETETELFCQIQYPNGKYGTVSTTSEQWPLARFESTYEVEPIELEELPEDLFNKI